MTSQSHHSAPPLAPSDWIRRFAPLISPGARVLDLACGRGRHGRLFLETGCDVTFLDHDTTGVGDLAEAATILLHDLETGPNGADASWPFPPSCFDAVIVTNYLHRPLFPFLVNAIAPGGVLLYETFALGNEQYGRPRNPDFLLTPGELLTRIAPLQVVAYEAGTIVRNGESRVVARIAAVRSETPVLLPKNISSN